MSKFVVLANWTQEGIKNVKDSPDRLDQAKKLFQASGAEILEFFLVMGKYDMVVITEAPDQETAAKLALMLGAGGAIRTVSMPAFDEAEYRKLIGSLS